VHYTVDHNAYPDGAEREYDKFQARRTETNELEIGGISEGQWVGAARIDATGAYAKDGDTIAGLVVDGEAWPDVRFMMIDCEETSLNSHAVSRHPEVADWDAARYARSGYKVKADAATDFLQLLMDTKGIDYIELNPHRDANGEFDDRVDAFGRYIGLVYGGGECFNAALVEQALADVYLYQDGKFHVPEMALKEFFSYRGEVMDSIEETTAVLSEFDVDGGLFEVLTALAYAARGYIWSVSPEGAVTFREAQRPDNVAFFRRHRNGLTYGADGDSIANFLVIQGSPETGTLDKSYVIGDSADRFGLRARFLDYFSLNREEDADQLAAGLLDDLAYPEVIGEVVFFQGLADIDVGDLIEFRDGNLRRVDPPLDGEWDNRFDGRLIARIKEVTHRFTGRHVETKLRLTSPLRSVANPISFITRSQPPAGNLFQFRLDEEAVGLDLGYHLD
jgi:hypothetical protein